VDKETPLEVQASNPAPQPIAASVTGLNIKRKFPLKKVLLIGGSALLVILVGTIVGSWLWYQTQLQPLSPDTTGEVMVVIEPNTTPGEISVLLEDKKVIKSSTAFSIYTRLTKTQNILQAGTYQISPSSSTPEIVDLLTSGAVGSFTVTFLPGATLAQNRKVLIDAGYSEAEVDKGLSATYDSPLFAGKPATTDLEGYIYGDTYKFGTGATVEEILKYTFDTFNEAIVSNNLVTQFKAQGLTLYEGITLASVIQREAIGGDEAQIAQVFYSRLALDMPLGSDVTYQYIADKTGVARDPNLDSPYNTRRYAGLPPGPIASPGIASLKAVGTPAAGDYLYFLSGDDNVTYFGRTNAEHEANIVNHCQQKCQIL